MRWLRDLIAENRERTARRRSGPDWSELVRREALESIWRERAMSTDCGKAKAKAGLDVLRWCPMPRNEFTEGPCRLADDCGMSWVRTSWSYDWRDHEEIR